MQSHSINKVSTHQTLSSLLSYQFHNVTTSTMTQHTQTGSFTPLGNFTVQTQKSPPLTNS